MTQDCPCGSPGMERSIETQIFPYGSGRDAVRLRALVPVFTCRSCGCQMTGPEAEAIRQAAVFAFLIAERDRPWPRMRSSWRRQRLRRRWRAVTVYLRAGRDNPSFFRKFRKASHG
jgi:hypothetical protein